MEHLGWAGQYIAKHKPDVVVHLGDHYDLPSLSTYEQKGAKYWEGKRYADDIKAGNEGMDILMAPIHEEIRRTRRNKNPWKPRLVFTLGNHEQRIERAINADPVKTEGLISYDDFNLEAHGFEVHQFLEPEFIDGVAYCHFFTSGIMGRPVSSASALLRKKMQSCVQGHVQDRDIAYARRADGGQMTGLFAGIFYLHDEDYLTPQTNNSWRGIWVLNQVNNGSFDELPVSMDYLRSKYGRKK